MTKSDPRLWVELNGLELHIYNRSDVYSKLEKVFGLESVLIPKTSKSSSKETNDQDDNASISSKTPKGKNMEFWSSWRDLIPVIKVELNMVIFLCLKFDRSVVMI